jgi:hypothetical protein
VFLDNIRHALIGEALAHLAVPVDAAKECARPNASGTDPLLERSDGAGDLTELLPAALAACFPYSPGPATTRRMQRGVTNRPTLLLAAWFELQWERGVKVPFG